MSINHAHQPSGKKHTLTWDALKPHILIFFTFLKSATFYGPRYATWTWLIVFALLGIQSSALAQKRYAQGIFYTYPSGKYVYDIHVSTWNAYFATNDGVLIYNQPREQWEDPVSLSNGLPQIPAKSVYGDDEQQIVWIVTPNYLTSYKVYSEWAQSMILPPQFVDKNIRIGILPGGVVLSNGHQAGFFNSTTVMFDHFITDSTERNAVRYAPIYSQGGKSHTQLPLFNMPGQSQFTASGEIETDYFRSFHVTSIGEGTAGDVFIGTNGGGIYRGNLRTQYLEPFYTGLLEPGVMSLNADQQGNILIGGMLGVTEISNLDKFEYFRASTQPGLAPGPVYISVIKPDDKNYLIGARGGVFRLQTANQNWTQVITAMQIQNRKIYDIAAHNRLIAVATGQNLYLKWGTAPLKTLFQEPDGIPIYALLFQNDTLWMGTMYGLYLYDVNGEKLLSSDTDILQNGPAPGASTPVYEMKHHGHKIWMATNRGVASFDRKTKEWSVYPAPVEYLTPRGMVVDSSGVWVGTEDGLRYLNPETRLWALFGIEDGLSSNFITDLAATRDYIWAGTDRGLTRISLKGLRLP